MAKSFQIIGFVLAAFLFAYALIWLTPVQNVDANGFIGLPTTSAIATTTVVGPEETVTIFAANKTCTARRISITDGTGVGITFLTSDPTNGDLASTSLSAINGHFQAASSTQAYEAGIDGCGRWTAYATASTTITTVEYR